MKGSLRFGVFCASVALVGMVGLGAASADGLYGDSNREGPGGLPFIDIDTVRVTNDSNAGTVTFDVKLAGAPPLSGTAQVMVLIHPGTWAPGVPPAFVLHADGAGASLERNGGASTGARVSSTYVNGVMSITVDEDAIDAAPKFAFEVLTVPAFENHQNYAEDAAPDAGSWTYALVDASPSPNAPTVENVTARFSHATAKPGQEISVTALSVRLSTGANVKAKSIACSGAIGSRPVKGTGSGHCIFTLPTGASGELVITTTGKYGSVTVASTDTIPIS